MFQGERSKTKFKTTQCKREKKQNDFTCFARCLLEEIRTRKAAMFTTIPPTLHEETYCDVIITTHGHKIILGISLTIYFLFTFGSFKRFLVSRLVRRIKVEHFVLV